MNARIFILFLLLTMPGILSAQVLITPTFVGVPTTTAIIVTNATTNAIYWTGTVNALGTWTNGSGTTYTIPNNQTEGNNSQNLLGPHASANLWSYTFGSGYPGITFNFNGNMGAAFAPSNAVANQFVSGGQPGIWLLVVSGTQPPVYTNYYFKINNNLTVNATATWYFNDNLVQQLTLAPGSSAGWLSPPVEVSPSPESVTFRTTLVGNSTGINFGPDGSPQFGPGNGSSAGGTASGGSPPNITSGGGSGGGDGGGGSLNGSGLTNGITLNSGTNSDVFHPNTNNIVWQAPSGSASESTLQAGFSTLHSDNANTLAGLNILHNDLQSINANTVSFTNELGQIITGQWVQTNFDGQMLSTLKFISTNLNGTNSTAFNFPTNLNLTLTNYATETTLAGISNLLGNTNFAGAILDTNAVFGQMSNSYSSGFIEASNLLSRFPTNVQIINYGGTNVLQVDSQSLNSSPEYATSESFFSNVWSGLIQIDVDEDFGDPDMTFDFAPYIGSGAGHFAAKLAGGSSTVIDFNPLHATFGAAIFAAVKQLWTWGLALAYLLKCTKDAFRIVSLLNETHGGRPRPATIAKVISD